MRALIIGAGRIGAVHATNIVRDARCTLIGVVDPDGTRAAAVAGDAAVYTDAVTALDDAHPDLVVVCSPTPSHAALITACAERGLACFCEKPIALDVDATRACLEVVARAGTALVVGFNRRFDPSFAALERRVRAGEIGAVEIVRITSRDPSPPPADYVASSGGLFKDMCIHDLDMARFILGEEPVSVFATGSVLVDDAIGDAGDIDTATVTLKTARGALCVIDNSRRAVYGYDQRLEAFGSAGLLVADNVVATTVRASTATAESRDLPEPFFLERYADAYRRELDHVIDVVTGAARPAVTGDDGLRALLLAEAAQRSLVEGCAVEV